MTTDERYVWIKAYCARMVVFHNDHKDIIDTANRAVEDFNRRFPDVRNWKEDKVK